jgi:hypothetical protein
MVPKPVTLIAIALLTLNVRAQDVQISQGDGKNRMLFAAASSDDAASASRTPAPGLPARIEPAPETPFEETPAILPVERIATPEPTPSPELPINNMMDEDPTMDQEANEAAGPVLVETPVVESPATESLPTEPTAGEPERLSEDLTLSPDMASPQSPSQSVTVNLINALVKRGILEKAEAQEMISMAEAEAEVARAQSQAEMFAIAQIAANEAAAAQSEIEQAISAPAEDDVRVTYIPEPVRTQIKEDIKLELINENRRGAFSSINTVVPEWVPMLKPFGDLRVRFEGINYPTGNDVSGAFPNFNAINTGAPFDVAGTQFAPQLNADQDRSRFRLRARAGVEVNLPENFLVGMRIATGSDNSPVSTNQSFGAASGQGGNFSKYAIWLDRAFLQYEVGNDPNKKLKVWAGRFDNPFFSTPVIWDDDLGFDGFAASGRYEILRGFTPFITGGAFPVYNTDLNFSSNQPAKFASYDKYLFAVQGGTDWRITDDIKLKVASAYYYFHNIEGQLSSPYTPLTINDAGDTDASRPSFAQKGNTYFPIRQIVPDASNEFGAINQWQYYGLATKFQNLAFTGRLDYDGFEPIQISLVGEIIQNLAFNKGDINAIAVNNRSGIDDTLSDDIGEFEGSGLAWLVELRAGHAVLQKRWDWNIGFGYRWIGSDAVVDGFNDSDFGLGGTNMQGFTVGGALALSPNVWFGVRWMGADSIAGPQYNVNILQLDLNARF